MGKVIRTLAQGSVPEQTIFDRRFVAECCETFHLHWRNLRLELTHENWQQVAAAMVEAERAWREHGSPSAHPHLELVRFLRDDDAVNGTSVGAELCENLYKTAPPPFGADAEFYEDDEFVHVHLRDLRIEMSVDDFVVFSGVMAEARERLLQEAAPTLARLFTRLDDANVVYAVARNWENLPDRVELGPHSDLDLLVHPAHLARVEELWGARPTDPDGHPAQRRVPVAAADGSESFVLVDLRAPGDGYYPEDFCQRALTRRVRHERGFWTLAPREHFLALAYHVVHHKGVLTEDYAATLVALSQELGAPLRPDDSLFAQLVAALAAAGVRFEEPADRGVLPKLPYLHPVETVLYSRLLTTHQGIPVHSRIYRLANGGGTVIAKQATGQLAAREGALLGLVDSPHFPKVLGVEQRASGPVLLLEHVDGIPLSDLDAVDAALGEDGLEPFLEECLALLGELRAAGISHRDVTRRNLLVRDGKPVLLDFAWALAPGFELSPEIERDLGGLGDEGRPPEGGSCDVYALGVALRGLLLRRRSHLDLVEAMTAPAGERVRDPEALLRLLREGAPVPPRAVLCLAAEVADDPSLLAAAAAEAASVAIYAPDLAPAAAGALLEPAVAAAGLDGPDAPELVVLAVAGSEENERRLAERVDAIATRREPAAAFAALPRIDAARRTLSACLIFRDEAPYLREWLEFHLLLGVEHFYLYDNESSDGYAAVVAPYVERGLVTVVDWPSNEATQCSAYEDCVRRFGHESQWIAFTDVDEFLWPPETPDLREALREFEPYGGVVVNFVNFGTSGHEWKPDGLVVESYLRRAAHDAAVALPAGLREPGLDPADPRSYHPLNARVKSVVQPARVAGCPNPHFFSYRDGFYAVTENHERHDGPITATVSAAKLRLNHYWTRSVEECRTKILRGDVNRGAYHAWPQAFRIRNAVLNDVLDGEILVHLPALRAALGLPEPPPAAQLLAACERRWQQQLAARYFVKEQYEPRREPEYFHDVGGGDGTIWQPDVYTDLGTVARRLGATRLVDVGCGSGEKLLPYVGEFELVGIDVGENIERCRSHHAGGTWLSHDLESEAPLPLDASQLEGAVIVCADVVEHLVRPDRLLAKLRAALEHADAVLLSTPERDISRGRDDFGPPRNPCHVREWSRSELEAFLEAEGFRWRAVGLTRANDRDPRLRTTFARLYRTAELREEAERSLAGEQVERAA